MHENDAVLFLLEHLEGIVGVCGCNDYLEENFVDFFGCGFVDGAVGHEHSSECAYGVACEGVFPGVEYGGAGGDTACIVMLEYGESRVGEFTDEGNGRVDVEEVVVGNLLAMELGEHFFEIAEEESFLMGILAVAHCLGSVDGHTQS